jgi:hypothetical protein
MNLEKQIQCLHLFDCGGDSRTYHRRLRVPERYTWSVDREVSIRFSVQLRIFNVWVWPEFVEAKGGPTLNPRRD